MENCNGTLLKEFRRELKYKGTILIHDMSDTIKVPNGQYGGLGIL